MPALSHAKQGLCMYKQNISAACSVARVVAPCITAQSPLAARLSSIFYRQYRPSVAGATATERIPDS